PEDSREHEGSRARHADGEHPEPEEQEEHDRPQERLHSVIDRRRPKLHRAQSTNSRRRGTRRSCTVKEPPEGGSFSSSSRSRFRPPRLLTFGFRLRPPGGASTYSRPVLDAS